MRTATASALENATGGARSERHGWKTVIASSIGLAFGGSSLTILAFGAFIAPLDREFGWGVQAISLGAAIISVMIMIMSPIQGWLVDRFGSRRPVLIGIPIFAAALAAMYFLPGNIYAFYGAWVAISICALGVWPISYLRATAGWFDKNLGLALGVANAGIGVGAALVPVIVGYLISQYGWRSAFLGLACVALLVWPVAYLLLADPVRRAAGVFEGGDSFREAVRTRPFWIALLTFFLLGIFTSTMIVHQVRIFIDAGIPPATATAIPSAFGIALIIARLGTGWLLDHVKATVIMPVFLCGGIAAALIYASGPTVPLAIVGAVLAGLIVGAEFDVLSFIIPRYHGRKSFGKITGTIFAAFQIASAIGLVLVGISRTSQGNYTQALIAMAAICVVCAVLFLFLGPYRYQRPEN